MHSDLLIKAFEGGCGCVCVPVGAGMPISNLYPHPATPCPSYVQVFLAGNERVMAEK
jgi:hypothetical protein